MARDPRSLDELRIWFAGRDELAGALAGVGDVASLRPGEWEDHVAAEPAAFLLVEAGDRDVDGWGEELARLLDRCKQMAVPRFLWILGSPLEPSWLALCERFDRVFTADRGHLPALEAAGATMPSILWPAVARPVEASAGDPEERPDPVVWLGGWREDWPRAWRERVASVLRGAGRRDLRIVPVEQLEGLPSDLRQYVTEPAPDRGAALAGARIAIAADAAVGSSTYCPPVAFEAAARGAAVITPHSFTVNFNLAVAEWRGRRPLELVREAGDDETALTEIDRLLGDERLRGDLVTHLQRVIANNHTYSHRLASLASAAGYRLLPDAHAPAPA